VIPATTASMHTVVGIPFRPGGDSAGTCLFPLLNSPGDSPNPVTGDLLGVRIQTSEAGTNNRISHAGKRGSSGLSSPSSFSTSSRTTGRPSCQSHVRLFSRCNLMSQISVAVLKMENFHV
jgi:hypothetical protein